MTEEKQSKSARSKSVDKQQLSQTSKKLKKPSADEKEEAKMKPSGVLSPYICYAAEAIPKFRAERNCTNTDAVRLAGAGWRELSEKDRVPYIEKSKVDKARYEGQLKMIEDKGYFLLKDGTRSCDASKGKFDDRMKPPHPISGYFHYSLAIVPKIKAEKNCTHLEATSLAGASWKDLSEKEKAPFLKKGMEDKARYDEQMQMFKAKGYFMLADGTKSSDYDPQLTKKKKSKSGAPLLQDQPSPSQLGKR
jgi:hypothetical protein